MKEGDSNNHSGLLGWSIGLLSVIFSIMQPFAGLFFGIVGLVSSLKSKKIKNTEWNRVGKKLSILGLILSIAVIVLGFFTLRYLSSNPELLSSLKAGI
jgi:vacuolar-type H+-ATPase subunit I/STV1